MLDVTLAFAWGAHGSLRVNVPLDRDIQVGDVMKDKVREGLVTLFADEFDEGLRG